MGRCDATVVLKGISRVRLSGGGEALLDGEAELMGEGQVGRGLVSPSREKKGGKGGFSGIDYSEERSVR